MALLVEEVTDVRQPSDGNRVIRKGIDRLHLKNASNAGQSIKLADLISNSQSIVKYDQNFAKVYLEEKEKLLEVLVKGDVSLYSLAIKILRESKNQLNELSPSSS